MNFNTQKVLEAIDILHEHYEAVAVDALSKLDASRWWKPSSWTLGLAETDHMWASAKARDYCMLHDFYSHATTTTVDIDFNLARELGLVKCE